MSKYLFFILLPLCLLGETAMKCAPGKCASDMQTTPKKIPQKEPLGTMKCEAGKCASGKNPTGTMSKKNTTTTKKPTIEQLFNVRTVQVKLVNTAKEQINYGYIKAQDSAMVDITTWYAGFVEELYADTLYKKVKKGDALAKVYSPEVYKAKQDYINSIDYNKKRAMPEMLRSAKIKLILLGVSQKEITALENNHAMDTYTTVYSPVSGWIFEKNINKGSAFSPKKRLFQIVNLESVWVEVKLFQDQLKNLKELKEFKVKVKGIDKTFIATKPLLYPKINEKEATVTLRLTLENKEELLKPGMYAKIYANTANKTRMVIPKTAAIRKNGKWYAFLATEFKGEYEPVEIELKPLDAQYYEVIKGLKEDDTLVENALFMMDSDAQINSIY